MLILSTLLSFASLSTDMYMPAMPAIAADLHADAGRVSLTVSTFLVGFSIGQLFWGPLSDRIGRRLPVAIGLMFFMAGSVGCAMSGSIGHMLAWRVVQAFGACSGPVLGRAMVRDLYARDQAARMLSTLMLIMGAAPLLGPLFGGEVLRFTSWRVLFWLLAVVALLTLGTLHWLPETLPPERRSRESARVTIQQYLSLCIDRRLLVYTLCGAFWYLGCYAFIAGASFVYVDYYHVTPAMFGILFSCNAVGILSMNFVNSRLVGRFSSPQMLRFGSWIMGAAGLLFAIDTYTGVGGVFGLVVPFLFVEAAGGLVIANSVASALAEFPRQAGSASSLIGAIQYGSGILSGAMLNWFASGTPWTLGWIIGLSGVGCVASLFFAPRPEKPA